MKNIRFNVIDPYSCEVEEQDEQGKVVTQSYRVPEKITTWQVLAFAEILADFMDASSEAGSALMNAILALAQTKDFKLAAASIRDYEAALPDVPRFGLMLTKGFGDVLKFAAKTDAIPRLSATLFLRPGELAVENIDERIDLFRHAPIVLLGGAVRRFLTLKIASLKGTPSGSKIFETIVNAISPKKPTVSSESSSQMPNVIFAGTGDSSAPSVTATSDESTE